MPAEVTLRPATSRDRAYCRILYESAMRPTVERLFGWDQAHQDAQFDGQWAVPEVSILVSHGADVGWMQMAEGAAVIFLKQLYVAEGHRGRGIGTQVLGDLLRQAHARGLAVSLGVVKGNPARRLYERLGFRPTHEDRHKVYLRCDPGP